MAPTPVDQLRQIRDVVDKALDEAGRNDLPEFQRSVLRIEELVRELVAETRVRANTL